MPQDELSSILEVLQDTNSIWTNEDVGVTRGSDTVISSIDFLQPIVAEEEQFGRIAALHAFSDIFAKGGTVDSALVILCWPRELIGLAGAKLALAGCQKACIENNVTIIGGHSIDSQNPIFGLSVLGSIPESGIIRTDTAVSGDRIFITKPLGVGVTSNAIRQNFTLPDDRACFDKVVNASNSIGVSLGNSGLVSAMTDVTGFGLLGQISKMIARESLKVHLDVAKIPSLPNIEYLWEKGLETRLGVQNRKRWRYLAPYASEHHLMLFSDPQTNGGLLFSASESNIVAVQQLFHSLGQEFWEIGYFY